MVFNIDYNKKHQISILEWFLKDHVTLKLEAVIAAENSALPSQE